MTSRSIRKQRKQREAERDMVDRFDWFDDNGPAFVPRVPITSNWSAEQ